MYGADSEKDLVAKSISTGIHQNVKIVEISVDRLENIGNTLLFKLEFEGGEVHSHREFDVNPEVIRKNIVKFRGQSVEEIVAQNQKATSSSIIHILSAFIPREKIFFRADDWDSYITRIVEVCGTAFVGELFRCKLVYDKKGYVGFPKSTASPFFQNMKEKDTLQINPKYDKLNAPTPTDESKLEPQENTFTSDEKMPEDLAF